MKKVYILKPSDSWEFCGGGRVAAVDSFQELKELFPDCAIFMTEEEAEKSKKISDIWVVVSNFTADIATSRIMLDNYNWA